MFWTLADIVSLRLTSVVLKFTIYETFLQGFSSGLSIQAVYPKELKEYRHYYFDLFYLRGYTQLISLYNTLLIEIIHFSTNKNTITTTQVEKTKFLRVITPFLLWTST